jgi:thiol-disulfide isomerase/thioredoxin
MNFFSDYISVWKAEWLKLKGSGIFWITLIMSAFIPALITLVILLQPENSLTAVNTVNPWRSLIEDCFRGYSGFFFPIFLTLIVVRLTQMEHRGGGWKLIETQPVSRLSLYLGKFSTAIFISLSGILSLVLLGLLGGFIIMLVKSGSGFSKFSVPFDFMMPLCLRLLVSSLGILGLQYFFSVIISGFLWPFGIGLIGTIAGSILRGFDKALWWPYTAPGLTASNAEGSVTGSFFMYFEWLSMVWMLLALFLGFQWYQRKTFKRAYINPPARLFYVIASLVAFLFILQYINRPVQLPLHNRTVIAGVFEIPEKIDAAFLMQEPLLDTVLEIPVVGNKFHLHTEKNIPPAVYYFVTGKTKAEQVFFGNNDSLFLTIKPDGKITKINLAGNRIPENQYTKSNSAGGGIFFNQLENFGYEMKPDVFARALLQQWRNEMRKVEKFKTADNLKPAPDFIALQKKLVTIKYLRLLDIKYPQWFRVYHPNEKLVLPGMVDSIRTMLSYTDSSLLLYDAYRSLVADYYQQTYRLSLSNDTAYLEKVSRVLPGSQVRDYLLYSKLKEVISRTADSTKREKLFSRFLPELSNPKMLHRLLTQHALLKSLNRGKPAPDFITVALNRDTVSLQDFRNRYVVIDVWATWCAPCKAESPHFERMAEQFISPEVAFVALSIDDNRWSWQVESLEKSGRVLQVIAVDKDAFGGAYGIEYIPRFMLLGPDGKIINAQMPEPSNPMFEEILKKEIPALADL